jgi:hypothetical protein
MTVEDVPARYRATHDDRTYYFAPRVPRALSANPAAFLTAPAP